jgi:hypothetical protein
MYLGTQSQSRPVVQRHPVSSADNALRHRIIVQLSKVGDDCRRQECSRECVLLIANSVLCS